MKSYSRGTAVALVLVVSAVAGGHLSAMQSRVSGAASSAVPAASSAGAVVPYTIHVPDAILADLKERLAHARLPGELPGAGWDLQRFL